VKEGLISGTSECGEREGGAQLIGGLAVRGQQKPECRRGRFFVRRAPFLVR